MKHILIILNVTLLSTYLLSMQQETLILIKLKDKNVVLPLHIICKSTVLHEKQLWKKHLNIPYQKPIVVPDITSQQMALFAAAASVSEKEFPSFYEQLSHTKQAELLHISHKDNLDTPGITALIAQTVLPTDIISGIIIPMMQTEKIAHYIAAQDLKKNLPLLKATPLNSSDSYDIVSYPNGAYEQIPTAAQPIITPQKTSLQKATTMTILDAASYFPKIITEVVAYKKANNCSYFITIATGTTTVWRINNSNATEDKTWHYTDNNNILCKTYNYEFQPLFSPDGKYLFLINVADQESLFVTLDHLSDDFITKTSFPVNYRFNYEKTEFNTSSTVLVASFLETTTTTFKLMLYEPHTMKNTILNMSHTHTNIFADPIHDRFCVPGKGPLNKALLEIYHMSGSEVVNFFCIKHA